MVGNIIVILVVCGAVFYLYRQFRKMGNPDSHSCGGCGGGCQGNENNSRNTIVKTMNDVEEKRNK